jgi:capsule biosynthesis phosphatase
MKYIILCGGIDKTTSLPNPLNYVNGRHLIEYIIENIPSNEIYIFYNIYLKEYNFEEIVIHLFKQKTIHFIKIDYLTRGPAETAYIGIQQIEHMDNDNNGLMFIDNDNVHNIPKIENGNFIGYGSHKNNESLSYIKIENNKVTNIEEKIKISDNYCCGIYGFINIDIFKQYCKKLINNNEYYFSQIYKLMIQDHIDITPIQIQYTKLFDTDNKLVVKPLRICFDLDNTLVTTPTVPDDYSTVNPIHKNIIILQQLKKMGHEIIIYTARRMKTHNNNIGKVIKDIALITIQTLDKYNIEYDELLFGKPIADIYIDDKALNLYVNNISYFGINIEENEYVHNKVENNKFNKIIKNNNIIKKSGPYSILKGEIYYYQHLPLSIKSFFPELYNYDKTNEMIELSMEYIKGIPLFYLYKNKLINPSHIDKLFDVLQQIHSCDIAITLSDQNVRNNYIKKTQDRYNKNDYFFEDSDEIFKCIINKLETYYNPQLTGIIHGDFWFSNIILDYDDNIKLIDMKGQVDGVLTLNGDIYYDYGKFLQSILGYDLIINDCTIDNEYISFIQEYFFKKCKEIDLDIEFLKAVTLSFLFSNIFFIENNKKLKVWEFIKKLISL